MTDKIVSVKGCAAMARAGFWQLAERTHVGFLPTGEPVSVFCSTVIIDMRPSENRLAR